MIQAARSMLRKPLHPFAFTVYFLGFLYLVNPSAVSPVSALAATGVLVGAFGALWLLLRRAYYREPQRAALLTTLAVFLFFLYGHAFGGLVLLYSRLHPDINQQSDISLSIHMLLSGFFMVLWILAARRDLPDKLACRITKLANLTGGILLLGLLPGFLSSLVHGQTSPHEAVPQTVDASIPDDEDPDIYLIVLDGYGREDVLRQHYDFDNSTFLADLRDMGFDVAGRSTANFNWTFLSLGSLLNMRYVTDLTEIAGRGSSDLSPAYRLVRRPRLVSLLQSHGYRYVHFNSTYGATMASPMADETVHCKAGLFGEEFFRALAETTWLRIFEFIVVGDLASCHLRTFELLEEMPSRRGPKFVFVHFIPPHHPYLFDSQGRVLKRATVANQMEFQKRLWGDKRAYIEQLRFINRRVRETVTTILDSSKRPPIIVILSDHGPQVLDAPATEFFQARFANLVAVHMPDRKNHLPDDVTLVNLFPYILNSHFGFELPIQPRRLYLSGYLRPYDFKEILENGTVTSEEDAAPSSSDR